MMAFMGIADFGFILLLSVHLIELRAQARV